jgi:hypothetical protein
MKTQLTYLGFVISSNKLEMDLEKVREIKEWISLRNIFDLRSFHGLTIFYRKFIRNFSNIYTPILDIVKKKYRSFYWTTKSQKDFKILKEKIT